MNETAETTNDLPCVGVADWVDSGSATGDSKVLPPSSVATRLRAVVQVRKRPRPVPKLGPLEIADKSAA